MFKSLGTLVPLQIKTLLRAIFQHNNCKAINIFYHKEKPLKDHENYRDIYQNYTDITYNISIG